MNVIAVFVIILNISCSVFSLKCFHCFSETDCRRPKLLECDYDHVQATATQFSFLPHALSQPRSDKFNCATYQATLANSTTIELSGCFFNTYNPCEEINVLMAKKWLCKYCDSRDGCNPASKVLANGLQIIFITIAVILSKRLI